MVESYDLKEVSRVQVYTLGDKSYYINYVGNILFTENRIIFRSKEFQIISSVEYSNLDCWYVQVTMKQIEEMNQSK